MAKVINFSNSFNEEPKKDKKEELKNFILYMYPRSMKDIKKIEGFDKEINGKYIFIGFIEWENHSGETYISRVIAVIEGQSKRFSFVDAKTHFFDPKILMADIKALGIDPSQFIGPINLF